MIQLPVGGLVEVLGDRKIVQADLTVREEALVLLGTYYPDAIPAADVARSMDRRGAGSVRNALSALWREKLLHRPSAGHVVLTERGLRVSIQTAQQHVA